MPDLRLHDGIVHLKGSSGLGDAISLRAIVIHLLTLGHKLHVYTVWPVLFHDLPVHTSKIRTAEDKPYMNFSHHNIGRSNDERITNFEAGCKRLGFHSPVPLEIAWNASSGKLIHRIKKQSKGRKILIFQPLKNTRGNGERASMRPNDNAYREYIASRSDCFRIQLGWPRYVDEIRLPCELNLFGKASIKEAFDIGTIADEFFGEHSYIPMMGEAMGKRFIVMFSSRAIASSGRAANLNPDRCFHRKDLGEAIYDG